MAESEKEVSKLLYLAEISQNLEQVKNLASSLL